MLKRLPRLPEFSAAAEHLNGVDLRAALHFLWRQWRVIAGAVAMALLLATIYIARQTPLYTATVQLLLEPQREKTAGDPTAAWDFLLDQSYVENQMAIVRSTALARRVVEKERLVDDPAFTTQPLKSGGWLASLGSLFGVQPAAQTAPSAPAAGGDGPGVMAAVETLKAGVAVAREGQSHVVSVSYAAPSPELAARLANAIADAYVVDKLDTRFESARRSSAWLSDRLVELRQKLRESEEAVAQFRAANNLEQSAPGATLSQEQLGQLNSRLVAARAETAEKFAKLELMQKVVAAGGNLSALPDVVNSGAITDLRRQESEASRQEADLLARYSDRHPSVVNVRAQLADIRRSMTSELRRLTQNIRNEYELAKARQDAVENTMREVTGQTGADSAKAITLRELERNAAVNKTLFEDFLQRSRVTQEQSTFQTREARIITPALAPGAPSSPNKLRIMLLALVLGAAAGVGGAYAVEMLNAGFSSPRQIEDVLSLPLLASVSRMEESDLVVDGAKLRMPEYASAKPLSRFSEAIRGLRSSIHMSNVDDPPRVLQVTSTIPSEGKTMIALTTACSAAQSGLRTLLIDCDLRHPSASRYFNAADAPGLVDYLAGQIDLSHVLRQDAASGVWVLPAGERTQNPPNLLSSEKLRQLVAALREKFDLVLIDTPPMGPVVDPLIVSQLVDKVIYVVRWSSTPREMVADAVERLAGKDDKVAGVVLNYVVDSRAQRYGRHAYAYYYGSRYYKRYYNE